MHREEQTPIVEVVARIVNLNRGLRVLGATPSAGLHLKQHNS